MYSNNDDWRMAGSPISCKAMMSSESDKHREIMIGSFLIKPQPTLNDATRSEACSVCGGGVEDDDSTGDILSEVC